MKPPRGNLQEALRYGQKRLAAREIPTPYLDALLLLMEITGRSKVDILVSGDKETLTREEWERYEEGLQHRENHMPMAYITGNCEFFSLPLRVTEDVLIPRGDTEVLVEHVLDQLDGWEEDIRLLDVCTGTGCIPIALASQRGHLESWAVDISAKALKVARLNVEDYGFSHRIHLLESDMFQAVPDMKFHVITSNPPYIPTGDLPGLPKSVLFEPGSALDGGGDGLRFYRVLAREAGNYLVDGGLLALEIGYNQAAMVKDIFMGAGLRNIQVIQDLAGLDRVVTARYKPGLGKEEKNV